MATVQAAEAFRNLGMSKSTMLQLASCVRLGHFAAGDTLLVASRPLEYCSYVVSGLISPSMPGPDGADMALSLNGAGTFLGVGTVLTTGIPGTSWVCQSEVSALLIPVADTLRAFETDAGFARYAARTLALHNTRHLEMYKTWRGAYSDLRVVLSLARIAVLLGDDDALTLLGDDAVGIPLTQSVLASLCGMSRSVFSGFLQQLVQADWVSADYGSLRLLNLSSWRALHHGRYRAPAPNGRGVDMQAVIAWMGQFRRLPAPV